jgi:hypothetical protein
MGASMSLAILATEDNWQGFDEAWTQLITSGGPVEELCVRARHRRIEAPHLALPADGARPRREAGRSGPRGRRGR